jgi:hypothetical protein
MKALMSILLLLTLFCAVLSTQSCKKDNPCDGLVSCSNGGIGTETVNGCQCDCSGTLYIGTNCENFNSAFVQALLNEGVTPKELYDGNVPLDSLYGKFYKNGFIFYLDTTDGTGLIAATEDQSADAVWGCIGDDLIGLNNVGTQADPAIEEGARIGDGGANTDAILIECIEEGIAAMLCRNIGPGWFLPSISELNLMHSNLYENGRGGFKSMRYWSSTEYHLSLTWFKDFTGNFPGAALKNIGHRVRAARAFG